MAGFWQRFVSSFAWSLASWRGNRKRRRPSSGKMMTGRMRGRASTSGQWNAQPSLKGTRPSFHSARLATQRMRDHSVSQGSDHRQIIAYHGTPSTANARSILRDGWKVGSGNSAGDGVYFARDLATARIYAGNGGVYLKCRILLGRSCRWDGRMESIFKKWCDARGATRDGSAKTAFLRHQGYDTLTDGKVVVILQPRYANPEAWKKKDRRIRILGVYRASDGRKMRV